MKTLLKILLAIVACMTIITMIPYVVLSVILVIIYAMIVEESIQKAFDDIISETKWVVGEIIDKIRGL